MARRRKRKYKYRSYQTSKWMEGLNLDLELAPNIVREMVAVLLIGLGVFTLLAILDAAGSIGQIFFSMLRLGLGWTSFVLPVILAGAGVALFYPVKYKFTATNIVGLVLLVISLSSLIHLFVAPGNGTDVAAIGAGGGYLGFAVALALVKLLDFWAALLAVIMLLAVSLLLVFGQPLRQLYYRMRVQVPTFPKLPKVVVRGVNNHNAVEEDDDEDEEEEDRDGRAQNPKEA
ncbi:DNA translocase FtsK 4TM domain-containing protein, partial [Patescibacteria group bacterium]|nr:DNA translocase FtsK 4TM domain-containing protein [Patescibacteria group bacterium]